MVTKFFFTVMATLLVFILLLTEPCIELVEANPLPSQLPKVTIVTPLNATYNNRDIPLAVSIEIFDYTYNSVETLDWLNYSLDGKTYSNDFNTFTC
ncbi:MAG: hypothetical protein ACQCN3_01960 [Candidatus Bathyarchaeia archaeon]|jgi:hypothetical protein